MTPGASLPLVKHFGGRPYAMRDVATGDAPEVLRLFTHAFGQTADQDWFDWKYRAGKGTALGLWDELDSLKAHCGGTPRSIAWCGKRLAGLQVGDVMVSTELRGLVLRKGPFQQVSSRFFASRIGAGRPFQFAWGFPNQRHMRLGVALGLFWDGGCIDQLSWNTRPEPPAPQQQASPWWSFVALAGDAKGFDRQVDAAWKAMAKDLQDHVLGVRDSAYIRWRFLARPAHPYQLFALRRRLSGRMQALVVMRIFEGKAELLDVIGPRSALRPALRAAINEAARAGAATLTAWASPALAVLMQGSGAQATPSGASLAIIKESIFSEAEIKAARWWWMGGDTDFL